MAFFTERLKVLKKQILHWLENWLTLTAEQQENLHQNVIYTTTIICRQSGASQVRPAGTLPFMQLQGQSNYCGLCAFNNLVGQEVITVQRMNNVADYLWLRQSEQLNLSLIAISQRYQWFSFNGRSCRVLWILTGITTSCHQNSFQ